MPLLDLSLKIFLTLRQSTRGLLESFSVDINAPVSDAFQGAYIRWYFYAGTVIDGVTLGFLIGAATEHGCGSTKGENGVDPPADSN